jgi:hypothetical protein
MRTFLAGVFGFVVMLSFTAVTANRPQNEVSVLQKLNGEAHRWTMNDGGQSGMFGSGLQCMYITPGDVLKMTPSADVVVCARGVSLYPDGGSDGGQWDGGCNTTVTDINYGDPAAANNPYFMLTLDTTQQVCMVPATGSANVPVFKMY